MLITSKNNLFALLTFLLLIFSCNSYKIKRHTSNNIIIDESLSSEDFSEIQLSAYRDTLESEDNYKIINYSNKTLEIGCPEGLLGNFISDLSLFTINQDTNIKIKADFCVLNNGGLRAPIHIGAVTKANIFELMPFDNELVIIELNPKEMKFLLDYIVQKSIIISSKKSGVPVSGIRLKINNNEILRCFINTEKFNENKSYYLLTTDYLADGGDNMGFLKECVRHHTKRLLRDIITNYIININNNNIRIDAELDGRITINK